MINAEKGYIIVNVFTAQGAIPLPGAAVTVTKAESANGEAGAPNPAFIARLFTDDSGITPRITVDAGYNNGNTVNGISVGKTAGKEKRPCEYYSVSAVKKGYKSVKNVTVPVYAGITSIQPVELIPVIRCVGIGGTELNPETGYIYGDNLPPDV